MAVTSIWNASSVTPAATDRLPVDVSAGGSPSRWTGQQIADLSIYIGSTVNALGSINTNTTINFSSGRVVTATITGALTFTFSNPPASGAFEAYLFITNGGSSVITWPGTLSWSGGTAPTLRASGLDLLRIYTNDGGTTYFGTLDYDETSFAASGAITTSGLTQATARLLGRTTASTGAVEEISVGSGLSLSAGSLTNTITPAGASGQVQYYDGSGFAAAPIWREGANTISQRNGTTTQASYVYKTYTDTSNYERLSLIPGAAAGWMQVTAETAGTGTDNIGIALTPAGTGAISAQVPDSTTTGGNARGARAVDWQQLRNSNDLVASGDLSVISGGSYNRAAAASSTVGGGSFNQIVSTASHATISGGINHYVTGAYSTISGGFDNGASGSYSWIPGGRYAATRGLIGAYAYASDRRSASGDAQVIGQPVRRTTTDATPVSLATDGTPAATTVMVLPANSTLMVTATVACRDSSGNSAGWIAQALFKRDGSNNTSRLGTATVTAIGTPDAAVNTATIDLVANDTLESAEIRVTGVAATTIYWVGELKCVQVA